MSRSPAGIRKTSPTSIVLLVDNAAQANIVPLVEAVNKAMCVIVPQFAVVSVGNSMAELFVATVGLVPETEKAAEMRSYPLPDTSVPPPVSDGAAVNRPTYQAVGRVAELVVNNQFSTRFSV